MKINIIGAGSLGKNLAYALQSHYPGSLAAICNRSLESAQEAVTMIGAGAAVARVDELPRVGLTFITTPDDIIASVVAQLVKNNVLAAASVVVHCSGVLACDVLKPLQEAGCDIASMHPLKAFRTYQLNQEVFVACNCVVEGDAPATRLLTELFAAMGANLLTIQAGKKSTYHAAAVMASNYVVTLAGCASQLMEDAGFAPEPARDIVQQLMQGSLTNLKNTGHVANSLTGPLLRGDSNTIAMHLQAITDPVIHAFYRAAALATLPLTPHAEETLAKLTAHLTAD